MGPSRRKVLLAGAAAATALAATAGTLAVRWWDRPAGIGYRWLSDAEGAFVVAFAEALFPAGGVPALGGGEAELDLWLDASLDGLPEDKARALKLLLGVLDDWPRLGDGGSFVTRSPQVRAQLVRGWVTSPRPEVRGAALSVALLLGCGYTTHPEAVSVFAGWHRCGYGR